MQKFNTFLLCTILFVLVCGGFTLLEVRTNRWIKVYRIAEDIAVKLEVYPKAAPLCPRLKILYVRYCDTENKND